MSATGDDLLARVESARARMAPVPHRVLLALARRVDAQQGEARRQLVARVEARLAAAASAAAASEDAVSTAPALAALTQLVERLDRHAGSNAPTPRTRIALPRPLKSVVAFQGTWSRLRTEQRLRQALAQVPAQAGPLNSAHIVSRALQTLHALSPAYLDAFMTHVDALQWMEQASGGGDVVQRAPRPRGAARS
ncbi:MAG TPA: DUF2894 domain-containing protein [Rhizobacter sp.]|nr:DUF2894 domain-containing protein [Rhizobacter sp.]